ncbi:CdaR family transcriptional regulator [Acetobacterium wieringae]|uniref:PucR family transcriptional regulator n=1 Tax=Acetobacterium wieringae TaxID=52694 RepID=UPI0026EA432E|nr:helix-turn-helix domain-containing protein [Acetobacterium wieringae]
MYYLKRIYQNFFNQQTVIIYNGQLVILLDAITAEIQNEREMASFENLLEENDCTAGISKIFYHLYDFCEHYKQAHNALTLGDQLKKTGRIRNYDDLIISHMILSFRGETNIKNLIHPVVKTLKDLDEKKGSNFLETLVAYINHNQDTMLTAKSLHVHYNTLKYRINQIIELTELDLSDSETLFNIQLSVKVNDILACL